MIGEISFNQQLSWTKQHMVRTIKALERLPDLRGVRLACSMHLDLKMVPLVEGLLANGAELFITTCNPTTVRDQVVDAMRNKGALVEAWHNMPDEAYHTAVAHALEWQPTYLCEMGADLSYRLLNDDRLVKNRSGVLASLEATGSGISRMEQLDLPYPVFNWDDLPVKEGLHNHHMVGLTTWQAFFARTQLTLHEKRVLVIGYGSVGRGIATKARAYGGSVTVAEKDPVRAIEASYDGWMVSSLEHAICDADVIVTATGAHSVITAEHFPMLKNGAFLLNCGHSNVEIDIASLSAYPSENVRPFIDAYQVEQKVFYLLANGAMFNLTAGEGDSLNAFDVTLALLVSGIGFIIGRGAGWTPGIHLLPREVWERVI